MDRATQQMRFGAAARAPVGQAEYLVPGTYSLTVPIGTSSMSAVTAQGGGAGGGGSPGGDINGGRGGNLRWISSFAVTPLEVLTIVVGAGATPTLNVSGGGSGAHSTIKRGSTTLLASDSVIAGLIGGGNGGAGGAYSAGPGGGGAGGYSGNGGVGGDFGGGGTSGSGGAGGGGGGYFNDGKGPGGVGGGVGLRGQGTNGAGGVGDFAPIGGSGSNGSGATPVGAGGAGGGTGTLGTAGTHGGVRVIWGQDRSYPSTRTADEA